MHGITSRQRVRMPCFCWIAWANAIISIPFVVDRNRLAVGVSHTCILFVYDACLRRCRCLAGGAGAKITYCHARFWPAKPENTGGSAVRLFPMGKETDVRLTLNVLAKPAHAPSSPGLRPVAVECAHIDYVRFCQLGFLLDIRAQITLIHQH